MTDSKWLLFILHQLLSNAVKYTDRGHVSIRVTSAPAIIVADTGIGIAPEDVPRVFEKGFTGFHPNVMPGKLNGCQGRGTDCR